MPLADLLEALELSNQEEVSRVLSDARGEADALLAAARAEADQRLGRTLEAERARIRQASERRRVAARRAAAARLLRARAELLDRIFGLALARARGVLDWPEYAPALEAAVRRILGLLGGDPGTLRCAPEDADRVRRWAAGSTLTVLPATDVPAGLSLLADEGRLMVDLTVPVRLARQRAALTIALGPALETVG